MSFTNAQLATKIADLIEYWSTFNTEYSNWVGGEVGGGPNLDGEYPLTNWAGTETLLPCPAQLSDNVTGYVAIVDASAVAAAASAAAALASEIQATADAAIATAQAVLADADRISAEAAEAGAVDAKVTAIAQAAAAVISAAAALVSETNAAASEAAAAISETNAAASAAAAATFDPALFMKLDGTQAMTGTLSAVAITASGAVTGSNLNVSNWDTAYGWGNHASGNYVVDASGLISINSAQAQISSSAPFWKFEETGVTGTPVWWHLQSQAEQRRAIRLLCQHERWQRHGNKRVNPYGS